MNESSSIDPDLVLSHTDWLLGLTHSLAHEDGDDLAQATWLAALSNGKEQHGNFRAWMRSIAGNLARRQGQRQAKRSRVEAEAARPERIESTENLVNRAEIQQRVLAEVMQLPQASRDTVLMRYFEGLSVEELSRRMGVPASTGRTRLARALDKLRDRLDKDYGRRSAWTTLVALPAMESGTGFKEILFMTGKAKLTAAVAGSAVCGLIAWQSFSSAEPDLQSEGVALPDRTMAQALSAEVTEEVPTESAAIRESVAPEPAVIAAPEPEPVLRPVAMAWLDVEDASSRMMQGGPMLSDFAKVAEDLLARIDPADFEWDENNTIKYESIEDEALGKASLHVNPGLEGKAGEFEIRFDLKSTPGFPIPEDASGSRLQLSFGVTEAAMSSCSATVRNHLRWDDQVNQRHLGKEPFLSGASLNVTGDKTEWRPLTMTVVRHDEFGLAHQNRMGAAQDLYVGELDDPRMRALAKRLQDFRFRRK
ncbi:MAG: RNA polymerase sigma factor [Planctomycetota bacterium]|jgi:RNA polymerase sigma-70 factor (ECF subfamily)